MYERLQMYCYQATRKLKIMYTCCKFTYVMEYSLNFITKDHNVANNIFPIIAGNVAQICLM